MSTLIETLVQDGILLCPNCRQAQWRVATESLHCEACDTHWPIRNRVPDLFNQYQLQTSADPGLPAAEQQALVEAILRALELETAGTMSARVAEIVERASAWACSDEAYTAEINDLLDRFAPSPEPVEAGPLPAPNLAPSFRLERHYLPESLTVGSRICANMRITNSGDGPWSSRLAEGLLLSASWLSTAATSKMTAAEVRFPIDIAPGRTISLPMPIIAPQMPGAHQLRL
ncbi:MAG: hypothetical protein C1943_11415 [Halochromatium sp.]|nr:hypothetical protein [Halochromatium sp.]